MERSEIRGRLGDKTFPDCASLHPGYEGLNWATARRNKKRPGFPGRFRDQPISADAGLVA